MTGQRDRSKHSANDSYRWRELFQRVFDERDPEKLAEIVSEMNRLSNRKKKWRQTRTREIHKQEISAREPELILRFHAVDPIRVPVQAPLGRVFNLKPI